MLSNNGSSLPCARTLCSCGLIVLTMATAGCAHRRRHTVARARPPVPRSSSQSPGAPRPAPVAVGTTQEGLASWYGIPYHGRQAANGEIYDMETLVAAHRTLPFDTWVRVTNLANQQSVTVRIIDRGPFVKDRIIDLSKAAARQINLLGPGVERVRLEVTAAPADIPANDHYAVQVAAFASRNAAEAERERYRRLYGSAHLARKEGTPPLYRVLVGEERSVAAAQQLEKQLAQTNVHGFVVRLDLRSPELLGQSGADNAGSPPSTSTPSDFSSSSPR